jgi:hypothetical protein
MDALVEVRMSFIWKNPVHIHLMKFIQCSQPKFRELFLILTLLKPIKLLPSIELDSLRQTLYLFFFECDWYASRPILWIKNVSQVSKLKLGLNRVSSKWTRGQAFWNYESYFILNGRNISFVHNVKYLGILFDKKTSRRLNKEIIEAKAFRIFIRVYSLFVNDRLSANIKWALTEHSLGP